MRKIIYIISIIALLSSSGFSQSLFSVSYDIGLPMGNTSDYIGNPSFRGCGIEARAFINDNLTYGRII
jgi:hypothetical protein